MGRLSYDSRKCRLREFDAFNCWCRLCRYLSCCLKLRRLGLSAVILEKGDQIGGTWHWNRYPGARCDIPSLEYSYQFDEDLQQEWNWSEKYSGQPEILEYINHVADRFELRDGIQFEEEVISANFNESCCKLVHYLLQKMTLRSYGFVFLLLAVFLVPNKPDISEGLENFKGRTCLQTSSWPQDEAGLYWEEGGSYWYRFLGHSVYSFDSPTSRRALLVFQRTPNYSIPSNNGPMDKALEEDIKSRYSEFRKDNYLNGFGIAAISDEALITETDLDEVHVQLEENWQSAGLRFLWGLC